MALAHESICYRYLFHGLREIETLEDGSDGRDLSSSDPARFISGSPVRSSSYLSFSQCLYLAKASRVNNPDSSSEQFASHTNLECAISVDFRRSFTHSPARRGRTSPMETIDFFVPEGDAEKDESVGSQSSRNYVRSDAKQYLSGAVSICPCPSRIRTCVAF